MDKASTTSIHVKGLRYGGKNFIASESAIECLRQIKSNTNDAFIRNQIDVVIDTITDLALNPNGKSRWSF